MQGEAAGRGVGFGGVNPRLSRREIERVRREQRRSRRRPGMALALGFTVMGVLLISNPYWGGTVGEENDRHEGLAAEVEREVGGDGGDGNALPPPPWAKMEHYLETLDGDRASGRVSRILGL
eukprot:891968-Rhodomonas_salina.1